MSEFFGSKNYRIFLQNLDNIDMVKHNKVFAHMKWCPKFIGSYFASEDSAHYCMLPSNKHVFLTGQVDPFVITQMELSSCQGDPNSLSAVLGTVF